MTRISIAVAGLLAAFAAGAEDIRFVPGQGTVEALTDVERAVAELAIATLAEDLGIPKDGIVVDTIRAIEWRDSSIGCPKPGRAYLDVVTSGHKVTLRTGGRVYVVHEAGNEAFVCRQTKALGGITPERELIFGRQLAEARKDLAARIGVPEAEIRFLAAEGQSWTNTALGCPELGADYPEGEIFGWKLTFGHADRTYTYHTDLKRTIPCPPITAK